MGVLRFIVNEVLSQPAYLIGIMALVGLLALRKPAGAVLTGTVKTIVGFLILTAGASLVIATLSPLGAWYKLSSMRTVSSPRMRPSWCLQ